MKKGRKIKTVLVIVFGVVLAIALAGIILNNIIEKRIRAELSNISPALQVNYSSVHAHIFSSSVSFDSLEIRYIPYSSLPDNRHSLQFSTATLKGISFYKFIFKKTLGARNLLFEDGNIRLDKFLIDNKDSAQDEIFPDADLPFKRF